MSAFLDNADRLAASITAAHPHGALVAHVQLEAGGFTAQSGASSSITRFLCAVDTSVPQACATQKARPHNGARQGKPCAQPADAAVLVDVSTVDVEEQHRILQSISSKRYVMFCFHVRHALLVCVSCGQQCPCRSQSNLPARRPAKQQTISALFGNREGKSHTEEAK